MSVTKLPPSMIDSSTSKKGDVLKNNGTKFSPGEDEKAASSGVVGGRFDSETGTLIIENADGSQISIRNFLTPGNIGIGRSEERRVGKECRRWRTTDNKR